MKEESHKVGKRMGEGANICSRARDHVFQVKQVLCSNYCGKAYCFR